MIVEIEGRQNGGTFEVRAVFRSSQEELSVMRDHPPVEFLDFIRVRSIQELFQDSEEAERVWTFDWFRDANEFKKELREEAGKIHSATAYYPIRLERFMQPHTIEVDIMSWKDSYE